MAIRISTTHIWTKLFIPIIWASRLLTIFLILSFLYLLLPTEGYWGIAYIIGFFGAIMLHASTLEQRYHVLQTYLYVVINLGTPISLIEAKKIVDHQIVCSDCFQWDMLNWCSKKETSIKRLTEPGWFELE